MNDILPASRDAEEAVVGSLLMDPDTLMNVLPILGSTGEKFTIGNLGYIYEAIVEMDARGDAVDLVTLTEFLDKKLATMGKRNESMLDQVGGPAGLTSLINATPTSIHAEFYAKSVRDSYTVRQVIAVAAEVTQLAYQHQDDPDYVLSRAEKAIYDIRGDRPSDVHTTKDLGISFQQYLQRKLADPNYTAGFRSTITNLDGIIGGLERNKLITIAGRPSFGKTAVATFIAWELVRQGNPTLLFSLEMSSAEMMRRFIALITGTNSDHLKTPGKLLPEEMTKVQEALGAFIDNRYPLYLSFGAKDVMEIRAHARRVSAQAMVSYDKPLAAVIVDYLQLLSKTPGSKAERRDLEIGEISRTLKLMSLEDDLNCLCVEVSQLSRAVESRAEKRPILPDLRDSGNIEQDSDIVIFTYPPLAYETEEKRRRALKDFEEGWEPYELIVAKNRDGPTGIAKCMWRRDCGRIRSVL